jgi:hypothetical protein
MNLHTGILDVMEKAPPINSSRFVYPDFQSHSRNHLSLGFRTSGKGDSGYVPDWVPPCGPLEISIAIGFMHKGWFPQDSPYILLATRLLDTFKVNNTIVQFRDMGRGTGAKKEAGEVMGAPSDQKRQ